MAIDWRSVIGLYGLWLVIVVLRIVALWRQSGTTGIRRLSDGPWSADGAARVLFVLAVGVGVASPVLVGAGVLAPASNVDRGEVRIAGLVLAVAGIALTAIAQVTMRSSWRIGVDRAERTELVTTGVFAWSRNPIYAGMTGAVAGLGLMSPTGLSLIAPFLLWLGAEVQTRMVEEPYLISVHGTAFVAYAAQAGRFVPSLGRLRPAARRLR